MTGGTKAGRQSSLKSWYLKLGIKFTNHEIETMARSELERNIRTCQELEMERKSKNESQF